jgi:hypothetical protein
MNEKQIKEDLHIAELEEARLRVWFREFDKMGWQTKNLPENLAIYNENSTKFRNLTAEIDRLIELLFIVDSYEVR